MKLKADESIEKSLEKLKVRIKKPSFNNNKGLTKIKQYIILDSIDFLEQLLDVEKPTRESSEQKRRVVK